MKRAAVFALAIFSISVLPAAAAPQTGTIRAIEVTSLTRQKAFLFVRTSLPGAARGVRQTFRGVATAWGVPVPLGPSVQVVVQPSKQGVDAVFLADLELARLPKGLLDHAGPAAVQVTLKGTLAGEAGTAVTVDASGVLHPGTAELVAGHELARAFVRFAGARLSGIGLSESKGDARIAVFNPLGFDVALRGLRYVLSSDGREVARGSRQGVLVRPGRENEIVLPLTVANSAAIGAAGRAVASGGTLSGELAGEIVLKLGTGDVRIPLAGSGAIEVLK